MAKLATIEKIHSIQPHPNTDVTKLEIGLIKGWPVVIPKGQYQNNDLVVFIQIDSIVPFTNPYFSFMERQKFRIWNARFKGAPSQGLVCPLSILPLGKSAFTDDGKGNAIEVQMQWELGDDVTDILGVTKYEKGLDSSICGDAKGEFPRQYVSITDEDNLLNYPEIFDEIKGVKCYLTVKADGSSMTTIYDKELNEVKVCSRRLEQKEGTGFWNIANKYDLPNKLKLLGKAIAIQGEACGGKIQGNPMGLTEQAMFVFNVKQHDTGMWYGYEDIKKTCDELGLQMVTLVMEPFIFDDTWNIARLQEIANNVIYMGADGKPRKAEGIVLRTYVPQFSPSLGKSFSVKILNQEYKQ